MAWYGESRRHSLSARGIKTGRKYSVRNSTREAVCRAIRINRHRALNQFEKYKLNQYQNLADFITNKLGYPPITVEYFNSHKEISECDGQPSLSNNEKERLAFEADYGQYYEESRIIKITPNTSVNTFLHEIAHGLNMGDENDAINWARLIQVYDNWYDSIAKKCDITKERFIRAENIFQTLNTQKEVN